MTTTVSIPTPAGFNIDAAVDWAIENCVSFKLYRLVEMSYNDKALYDCWFNLEIDFEEPNDAILFKLRWA